MWSSILTQLSESRRIWITRARSKSIIRRCHSVNGSSRGRFTIWFFRCRVLPRLSLFPLFSLLFCLFSKLLFSFSGEFRVRNRFECQVGTTARVEIAAVPVFQENGTLTSVALGVLDLGFGAGSSRNVSGAWHFLLLSVVSVVGLETVVVTVRTPVLLLHVGGGLSVSAEGVQGRALDRREGGVAGVTRMPRVAGVALEVGRKRVVDLVARGGRGVQVVGVVVSAVPALHDGGRGLRHAARHVRGRGGRPAGAGRPLVGRLVLAGAAGV